MTSLVGSERLSVAEALACYHCGLPVPPGDVITVPVDNRAEPVCCHGCEAAYHWLQDQGLDRYYALRQARLGQRAEATAPAWSTPEIAQRYLTQEGEEAELLLALGGLRCSACAWLAEKSLSALPEVTDVHVQLASERLRVRWRGDASNVPRLAKQLRALGFEAAPARSEAAHALRREQGRRSLARLGLAAVVTMQIMMLSVADYLDLLSDLTPAYRQLLLWAQGVLASLVMVGAAGPFFQGAWRSLRLRHLTMDVPVALALGLAYGASLYLVLSGKAAVGAPVYFDSLAMFTLFLLAGRFAEERLRHRFAQSDPALETLLPLSVDRLKGTATADTTERETVHPMDLLPGDRILVPAGAAIPCEAVVLTGSAALRLDHLTGEAAAKPCAPGDAVPAGATVLDGMLTLSVRKPASEGNLAALPALLARARESQGKTLPLLDRIARKFFAFQLLIALGTGLFWWAVAPEQALEAVLATLIIACPCAVSLATPAARTTGALALRKQGLRLGQGDALERLAQVSLVVLDKTGTLTAPEGQLHCLERGPAADDPWGLAKGLEQDVDHPLARAFDQADASALAFDERRLVAGSGVEGTREGHTYRLGRPSFCGQTGTGITLAVADGAQPSGWRLVARFAWEERLRGEVKDALEALRAQGLRLALLSGDATPRVEAVAKQLGIGEALGDAAPEDKLRAIQRWTDAGERVLYVGDGLNDAPALGGATVSLALGAESAFARDAADLVSVRRDLRAVPFAVGVAKCLQRRLRRNIFWAVGYNVAAVPLAVAGLATPWLAALGMTLSSLVVLVQAQRLAGDGDRWGTALWKA